MATATSRIGNITDETMLTSESYRLYLQRIVRAQSGNYLLRVLFGRWPQTNGSTIWLLPNASIYDGLDLARRTLCIMGNLAHEFSHVRWTDFEALKEFMSRKTVIAKFLSMNREKSLLHRIANTIEDSFIEAASLAYYRGVFFAGIHAKNEVFYAHHPSQEELYAKGVSKLEMALAYLLEDAKYHKRKTSSPDTDVESWFWANRHLWLDVLSTPLTEDRLAIAEEIYRTLLPWADQDPGKEPEDLKSHMEWQRGENSPEDVDPSLQQKLRQLQNRLSQEKPETSDDEGGEDEVPVSSDGPAEESSPEPDEQGEPGSATGDESGEPQSSGGEGSEEGEQEGKRGDESSPTSKENGGSPEGENQSGESPSELGGGHENKTATGDGNESAKKETGNESSTSGEGESATESEGPTPEQEEEERRQETERALENLDRDLEQVREDEAARQIDQAEAKSRQRQLQQIAAQMQVRTVHRGIELVIEPKYKRDQVPYGYEDRMAAHANVLRIGQKRLKEIIRTNDDRKMTGLTQGRLQQNGLYRRDGRIFYERKEKSEEKKLMLGILFDESGSMNCRADDMIAAGIYFAEIADALGIPCAIYGHNAPYYNPTVNLRVYRDYDDPKYFKYSLVNMKPSGGTRDGVALAWVEKRMLQRQEPDKLLICITDGVPHHYRSHAGDTDGYCNSAMADTAMHVKRMTQKGIDVIGLCIGEEAKEMHGLYPHAIDIPNLTALTTAFVRIVQKNLFK